ncbi:MAG: hypothetical protein V5A28_13980 [Haloarculaceae archaeon]
MSATASRWSRVLVATGVFALVAWQVAVVGEAPRRTAVTLGVFGFVLHVVFGKAYALVPSYFDRELAWSHAPAVQLPLTAVGVGGLALAPLSPVPGVVGTVGAIAWGLGVGVFLATLLATVRTNLTGAETATGEHNADRRPVDRAANLFVPVALAYLAAGTWETLALHAPIPGLLDGYPPRVSHLLAAGTAAVLVFAVGFRLLPRFLVTRVDRRLPWAVLPAGALGPALVAVGLPGGPLLHAGAGLEAVAVAGWAVAFGRLYRSSDRDRVGFYGPLAGALAGLGGVAFGLWMAFDSVVQSLAVAHYRLNVLGFLGLTVVGVTYQFYPPAVGRFPGAGDRLALVSMALVGAGLAVEVAGALASVGHAATAGRLASLAGALLYAYLVLGVFLQRALERGVRRRASHRPNRVVDVRERGELRSYVPD